MAFIPYWRKDASTFYNVLAFCAFWSLAATAMATVGGATNKWVDVRYPTPQDGTSYTKGLWHECAWGDCAANRTYISPSKATSWERACQAFYFLFIIFELIAAVMFIVAMRRAGARAAKNTEAKLAGFMSMFAGFCGLITMSIFVAREPTWKGPLGGHVRHLHWSYGLFTAAWALAVVLAPLGFAA